jgi:hypothetical protein
MKVIRLRHHENNLDAWPTQYAGTLGDAKKVAATVPKPLRDQVIAEELDVQTDKAGVVAMLNDAPEFSGEPLRTWAVTARGSLKEE